MPGIREVKISYIAYLMALATFSGSCQKSPKVITNLHKISTLSSLLNEVSGITSFSGKELFAINDSGNKNVMFRLNSEGKILEEIKLPETKNVDWEDLAYDDKQNIYVGDFGNNNNNRKDLTIYRISGIDSQQISTSKIHFSLEDQKKFPPKKKKMNYDIEAFIHLNGNLYLFSKNRSSKFEGATKLYKIPATPGKHVAKLIGTYNTCSDPSDCFITGATINQKGDKIVLLTYNKLYVLSNFKGDQLFSGDIQKIQLNHFSQKEGICFKDENTLFITSEKTKHKKPKLYKFLLK